MCIFCVWVLDVGPGAYPAYLVPIADNFRQFAYILNIKKRWQFCVWVLDVGPGSYLVPIAGPVSCVVI